MTDLTEGQRIYAIGDIHGRLDLLTDMLDRIRRRHRGAARIRGRWSSSSATTSIAVPRCAASSRR